jgi:WD40 repeat protein
LCIDNQILASGSHSQWAPGEGDIQFLNLNTGKVRRLSGYLGNVRAIAISPDSRTLINGTSDGKIKILDLKNDKVICTLSEHLDVVISLAISSDGKTLASGSFDGTIKVWRIQ